MKSFSDVITLTFTQCKQLIEKGVDLRDFCEDIENQPEFIKSMGAIDSIADIQAIQQGGCASGAYMPAVTYSTALECMVSHNVSVESQLEGLGHEFTFYPSEETFSGFAVKIVSAAVETWAASFDLDGVDWD